MDAGMNAAGPGAGDEPAGGGRALALVLAATFLVRAIGPGQPIVENYVGRQVPTAMVARNLERGSGLLRPRLDTAPLPNYFVVEPPLYEVGAVALRRATGLGLEASGRLLSAMATAAAGWGIFELLSRRSGRRAAILAALAFAAFPLTIRYGRAFQPDAAMLGAVVAGLACWDHPHGMPRPAARRAWAGAGWMLLAAGLAIKIIAAPLAIALAVVVTPRRRLRAFLAACTTAVPALAWYAWAAHLVATGGGSRASADNRAIWLGLLAPSAPVPLEAWMLALRFLLIRAFTPIGAALALFGLVVTRRAGSDDRGLGVWRAWGLVALATLALLASKLHHEYYLLILAPAVAAGVGIGLDRLAAGRRWAAITAALALLILSGIQSRSTWRTPPEWAGLEAAARAVAAATPAADWVVAPEALLFASDRRGCRLEWTESAARRAAGEWGERAAATVRGPIDLVEHYRRRGARYFADLGDRAADPRRMALHDAVRRRYKVIIDRPEVLIADLESVPSAGMLPHAN
jgi:Dolichyl-phosphate-mannose-protein mannosyltransferase